MPEFKFALQMFRFLKGVIATALCVCLLGVVFSGSGICQTPGYGRTVDDWAPYESGQYLDRLQKIAGTYQFSGKITYHRFELSDVGIGPVDLFRIPARQSAHCSGDDCYFFVLIASDYSGAPLVTPCQFKQAVLTHLFNPDSSRTFLFEFTCADALLQVGVTPTSFMAVPVQKTP
jgi:hypothetical protein